MRRLALLTILATLGLTGGAQAWPHQHSYIKHLPSSCRHTQVLTMGRAQCAMRNYGAPYPTSLRDCQTIVPFLGYSCSILEQDQILIIGDQRSLVPVLRQNCTAEYSTYDTIWISCPGLDTQTETL